MATNKLYPSLKDTFYPNLKESATSLWTLDVDKLLLAAVKNNDQEGCENALKSGASVNAVHNSQSGMGLVKSCTPIHFAAQSMVKSAIFQLLVDNGADILAQTANKVSILNIILNPLEPNISDQFEKVDILMKHGLDINASKGLYGEPSLSNIQCVAHTTQTDCNDIPPCAKMMEKLISCGGDLNMKDMTYGTSCLEMVAMSGCLQEMEMLLKHGVNPRQTNRVGWTPLHHICSRPYRKHDEERIQKLIACGADVTQKSQDGHTPLHLVCKNARSVEHLKEILKHSGETNVKDCAGKTPLHLYLYEGKDEAFISELIKRGANINSKDMFGLTPLHVACHQMAPLAGGVLVQQGAHVEITDKYGRNALHHYILTHNLVNLADTPTLLLRAPFSEQRDKYGNTPLDYMEMSSPQLEHTMVSVRALLNTQSDPDMYDGLLQKYQQWGLDKKGPIRDLLTTKGLGIMQDETDYSTVQNQVVILMQRIADELVNVDARFKATIQLSGSASEGTTIGLPDEYEFLFVLEELSNVFTVDEGSSATKEFDAVSTVFIVDETTSPPGYATLSLRYDTDRDFYADVLDDKNHIVAWYFADVFSCAIHKILSKEELWEDLDLMWIPEENLQMCDMLKRRGLANVLVNLTCPLDGQKDVHLTVDVAPVIKIPGWWPKDARDMSDLQDVSGEPCIILTKFASSFTSPSGFEHDLRISFCDLESRLLQNAPLNARRGYILAKAIVRIPQPSLQIFSVPHLQSNPLKTILFFLLFEDQLTGAPPLDIFSKLEEGYAKVKSHLMMWKESFDKIGEDYSDSGSMDEIDILDDESHDEIPANNISVTTDPSVVTDEDLEECIEWAHAIFDKLCTAIQDKSLPSFFIPQVPVLTVDNDSDSAMQHLHYFRYICNFLNMR